MREDYQRRARALVGTRFRPQGRAAATGVDCVGLVLLAYGIDPNEVRRNYRLRGDHQAEAKRELARFFCPVKGRPPQAGELLVLAVSAEHIHFGIRTDRGLVHADARLGRVVETPGAPPWPVLGTFRKRCRAAG